MDSLRVHQVHTSVSPCLIQCNSFTVDAWQGKDQRIRVDPRYLQVNDRFYDIPPYDGNHITFIVREDDSVDLLYRNIHDTKPSSGPELCSLR